MKVRIERKPLQGIQKVKIEREPLQGIQRVGRGVAHKSKVLRAIL